MFARVVPTDFMFVYELVYLALRLKAKLGCSYQGQKGEYGQYRTVEDKNEENRR